MLFVDEVLTGGFAFQRMTNCLDLIGLRVSLERFAFVCALLQSEGCPERQERSGHGRLLRQSSRAYAVRLNTYATDFYFFHARTAHHFCLYTACAHAVLYIYPLLNGFSQKKSQGSSWLLGLREIVVVAALEEPITNLYCHAHMQPQAYLDPKRCCIYSIAQHSAFVPISSI